MEKPSLLTAIKPNDSSEIEGEMTYPNLMDTSFDAQISLGGLWSDFNRAETGSSEELVAARDLSRMYLIMSAVKASITGSDKELWANRFTQSSSELYGSADSERAFSLLVLSLDTDGDADVNENILAKREEYIRVLKEAGIDLARLNSADHSDKSEAYAPEHILQSINEGLMNIYGNALNKVTEPLDPEIQDAIKGPEEIKTRFERGIQELTKKDERWEQCTVEIEPGSRIIRVSGNKVLIGEYKTPIKTEDGLRRLFTHEVLVHAQLNIHGVKNRNLEGEEGLAVICEQAFGLAQPPQRIIDRYVDISIALGQQSGGNPVNREQLMRIVVARNKLREAQGKIAQTVPAMATHVNRIYRGTRGAQSHVGVFTKDIVYYVGYFDQVKYFTDMLKFRKADQLLMQMLTEEPSDDSPINSLR